MRFFALLKKELRECLPWAVSAAIFLLIFGSLKLWDTMKYGPEHEYPDFQRYSQIFGYRLINHPFSVIGILIFLSAVGLGLALGVRQFWAADFMGVWGFVLHRSVSRTKILSAKICAFLISLITSIGLVWCYLFWRARLPDYLLIPPTIRHFLDGWLVIGIGFMTYLGTALAGLSKARWYTTKLIGLGFVLWMFITFVQQTPKWALTTLVISIVILLCLMWEKLLEREI